MADVLPFKAIRPTRDKVAHVVTKSYHNYSKEELQAELDYNPFSFLHIINPGYKYQKEVQGNKRFKLVKNRFLEYLEDHIFLKEQKPCYYIYKREDRHFSFCGIFAATSIADYENNVIKKHEDTIESREELFKEYLKIVRFDAEPVLMTYKDNQGIDSIVQKYCQKNPQYYFTTKDKITHTLWVITEDKTIKNLNELFSEIPNLYIADGHHRSASSALLAKEFPDKESYQYFMSFLLPESQIKIFEYNRMVKDLNGHTKESFLIALDAHFRIENLGNELYKPTAKHHFSMYLDGEFYALYLRKRIYEFSDPLSKLDTQILYKTILEPILGITDLRNDRRIQYGYGKHNAVTMKDQIDNGKFAVGFGLVPIAIEEIKSIADHGLVMPPKSTYIEPKLKSGLTIYEID